MTHLSPLLIVNNISLSISAPPTVNNNTKNSKTQVDFVDVNRSLGSSPPSVKKTTRNVKSRKSLPSSDPPKVFARKSLPPVTAPDVEEDDEETNMEILQVCLLCPMSLFCPLNMTGMKYSEKLYF